jgi:uncharacterized membrane protein YhfC
MVSKLSIVFIIVSIIISVGFSVGLFIYFYRKSRISIKAVIVGALTFIVFTQVLEKLLHIFVIKNNFFPNPWQFAIYGMLAAGVFEEVGRFISYKLFLKNNKERKDGIAFGIGHGGIEAILIGGLANIQYIVFVNLINTGMLEKTLSGKIPVETLSSLKALLVNSTPALFLMGGVERIVAVTAQIALSLLVLLSVRYKKYSYLILAIIAHALMDFPAALYQMHLANIWVVEGILMIMFVIALVFIRKTKYMFEKELNI